MAHAAPEYDPHKRKRDVEDNGHLPGQYHTSSPATNHQGGAGYINYLPRADSKRLGLLQGDADTFADIVGLIGVLERHESLAASLGAKLTGPRLLKGIEKFFDGPIRTSSSQPYSTPISWLDIVSHAKANPNNFVLTTMPDGARGCHFICKGVRTEITEDDWRLISSGALDRFPLERPFEEDETAELATLDILEQRASILYKKADEVAARARILHHKLGHRRSDLMRRRQAQDGGSARFHAVNQPTRPSSFTPCYDLHADLLQQYTASPSNACAQPSQSTSGAGVSAASLVPLSPSMSSPQQHQVHRLSGQSGRLSVGTAVDAGAPREAVDHGNEVYRALITQNTDKLAKGEIIYPPCDRCRRLRLQCTKHLTACQGCTKKHAKCSWKTLTDDEMARLRTDAGGSICIDGEQTTEASEAEAGAAAGSAPDYRDARVARVVLEDGGSTLAPAVGEGSSRPASRAGTDLGVSLMRSPDLLPAVKTEGAHDTRRNHVPVSVPSRDQSRMSRISALITQSD
ncbi:hypothetical protein HIM_09315 [Hirsutella minnesotensis 3608]|uniref:Zn(2)-C6 fungal-type domain-containing protein n=1 Tax=Hirsutella minnesotensis 3608 TaxID=1043627 RepID=A0A0F7ZLP0_9HYPO|nr:hypothetical protein HIM_09315 [Hirsutella minnesotensis 3608]